MDQPNPTACLLVVGNEVLSGRTFCITTRALVRRSSNQNEHVRPI